MQWYNIQIPETDSENFTTSLSIGGLAFTLEFMRIEAPLFGDRKWRCWCTMPDGKKRQVSLFSVSWLEYYDYGFVTDRRIKYPLPTEISNAFILYLGISDELVIAGVA